MIAIDTFHNNENNQTINCKYIFASRLKFVSVYLEADLSYVLSKALSIFEPLLNEQNKP